MALIILDQLVKRVETADDDSTLFDNLMYAWEATFKLLILGLIAAVEDDTDRNRYRLQHRLIRTDGLGEWLDVLDDLLTGPANQFLQEEARREQNELTQKCGPGTWQYDLAKSLHDQAKILDPLVGDFPRQIIVKSIFTYFVSIRNGGRGHGAPTVSQKGCIAEALKKGLSKIVGFGVFEREWAYLYRNLSGKYRITPLSSTNSGFEKLRKSGDFSFPNGIFIRFNYISKVDLIYSDVEGTDFFIVNGGFKNKQFKTLSYASGSVEMKSAADFLNPATSLPESETSGVGNLETVGKGFSNVPPRPSDYIHRKELERELQDKLMDDRNHVVTLRGKGGTGKTYLALNTIHYVLNTDRFIAVFWFSARDIDLSIDGPKMVKADVLSQNDVAKDFVSLMQPKQNGLKGFNKVDYFTLALSKSPIDNPILFVFDNFETMRNPLDVFNWISSSVRLPNKILITTRKDEFKGDYPIEVKGMSESECDALIDRHSDVLGVSKIINRDYRRKLFMESEGHPYVVKVVLGEVAKVGKLVEVQRLMANREDILSALFERTFGELSPAAKRIFLGLCSWRSVIPFMALEAMLLRKENEDRISVDDAVEELQKSSLIEVDQSPVDQMKFISVPTAASAFGRKKVTVSELKTTVLADVDVLRNFGAGKFGDIKHGFSFFLRKFFSAISGDSQKSKEKFKEFLPILEFLGLKYPEAFIFLEEHFEGMKDEASLVAARKYAERFLELVNTAEDQKIGWSIIHRISGILRDANRELQALVELSLIKGVEMEEVSVIANKVNSILRSKNFTFDTAEKKALVRQLISKMIELKGSATATDFSRLAWLYLNLGDKHNAGLVAKMGLEQESANKHCLNVLEKVG